MEWADRSVLCFCSISFYFPDVTKQNSECDITDLAFSVIYSHTHTHTHTHTLTLRHSSPLVVTNSVHFQTRTTSKSQSYKARIILAPAVYSINQRIWCMPWHELRVPIGWGILELHSPSFWTALDNSVVIKTRYVTDGLGIESRWEATCSVPIQTGPGAHPASRAMGPEAARSRFEPGNRLPWDVTVLSKTHIIFFLPFGSASQRLFCSLC
jgi:hypothetical protein